VIIAADISPIDVLSHLPILCEEKNVPYIYVKSRAEIGEACKTKRPTSCVLVQMPGVKDEKMKKSFDRCNELIMAKNPYVN
jgi:H/ACA ribonucleoprotein complex subunit 2